MIKIDKHKINPTIVGNIYCHLRNWCQLNGVLILLKITEVGDGVGNVVGSNVGRVVGETVGNAVLHNGVVLMDESECVKDT